MKKEKDKKIRIDNGDTKEIRNLIIITLVILAIATLLYILTEKVVDKKVNTTTTTAKVEINYDICTVGTMFNRPYDEYYVFLYDSTSENSDQYNSLLNTYKSKTSALKIYYVDLSKKFNSTYVADTSNKNPSSPSEVKIKSSALILIKNGKVSKYYETVANYEKVLN